MKLIGIMFFVEKWENLQKNSRCMETKTMQRKQKYQSQRGNIYAATPVGCVI